MTVSGDVFINVKHRLRLSELHLLKVEEQNSSKHFIFFESEQTRGVPKNTFYAIIESASDVYVRAKVFAIQKK